ncbi:MAG: aminoacyl-tRNA hydrolase [Devosiaceae bacterium]|nr:aminoacyl-tRNA hydrolase [Devosiaceae bacterium]
MFLLVGLGNKGDEYKYNRHNIGFMVVDDIAKQYSFSPFKKKYKGLFADGKIDGIRVLLLKPQTFMNKSGSSVAEIAKFFKIPASNIIVFYDELDLLPGKVRVKIGGGNGGHNGLRSIDPIIGKDYKRVRIGIGHPGHKDRVTSHVLSNFAKSDAQWLGDLLNAMSKNVALLLKDNDAQFMNKIALAVFGETLEKLKTKSKQNPSKVKIDKTESLNKMAEKLKNFLKRD